MYVLFYGKLTLLDPQTFYCRRQNHRDELIFKWFFILELIWARWAQCLFILHSSTNVLSHILLLKDLYCPCLSIICTSRSAFFVKVLSHYVCSSVCSSRKAWLLNVSSHSMQMNHWIIELSFMCLFFWLSWLAYITFKPMLIILVTF